MKIKFGEMRVNLFYLNLRKNVCLKFDKSQI